MQEQNKDEDPKRQVPKQLCNSVKVTGEKFLSLILMVIYCKCYLNLIATFFL